MKRIFALFIILCATQLSTYAQLNNNYNGLGSSASGSDLNKYDRNGNPIDTSSVVNASTIPIGLYQWKIDNRFGRVNYIETDTLGHNFNNSNDTGGYFGEYNYLGNLGSPRLSRIFFDRNDPTQEFFTDPYDFSIMRPEDVVFSNTLSPYTNLSYFKGGGNRNAEEKFNAYFAVNVNKRFGFGFYIDYIYGRGLYNSQSTALFNGGLFASYIGDKYNMHAVFNNSNLKMAENGGIADDRYITNPLEVAEGKKEFAAENIPVNLDKVWNNNTGNHGFLTHRYNLGFYRERRDTIKNDSVEIVKKFIPVTSFIHTLRIDDNRRRYVSYDDVQNQKYFLHNYLGSDSTDITKQLSIKNTFAISLQEGFNKWAKSGLTAFIGYEYRNFALTDTIASTSKTVIKDYKENVVTVGGELSKMQGKTFHYSTLGEIAISGEDAGQFNIQGKGDLNLKLFGDTVRLNVNGYIRNDNPVFYFRRFHSKHYWWNNDDLSKVFRTRVEGKLNIDRWNTSLRAGVENIKNYTYLANTSTSVLNDNNEVISYKNNASVEQYSENLQVFSAIVEQKFKIGVFNLDAQLAYQKSSNKDVLPLPDLSMYGNFYINSNLVKNVLRFQLGADVRYFSKYYAPDYSPAIGQFYTQNPNDRIEIGAYPIINVYANLQLKRTKFFLMMYHINEGSGSSRYFLAPHYPINPQMFKFGLSWRFYD